MIIIIIINDNNNNNNNNNNNIMLSTNNLHNLILPPPLWVKSWKKPWVSPTVGINIIFCYSNIPFTDLALGFSVLLFSLSLKVTFWTNRKYKIVKIHSNLSKPCLLASFLFLTVFSLSQLSLVPFSQLQVTSFALFPQDSLQNSTLVIILAVGLWLETSGYFIFDSV